MDRALTESLDHLVKLTQTYDDGTPSIAMLMSIVVTKILSQNGAAVKARGNRRFPKFADVEHPRQLNVYYGLCIARIDGEAPIVDFVPRVEMSTVATVRMEFKDWWNNDIIYRASAAVPGTPAGQIPVNGSPSVPFDKRETISRRRFVELLRNKLGAHEDVEMPILLDELEDSRRWVTLMVMTPDGPLSTADGSLRIRTGVMAATMRQIAHEVLLAYDR